jgi:hypothetical protein
MSDAAKSAENSVISLKMDYTSPDGAVYSRRYVRGPDTPEVRTLIADPAFQSLPLGASLARLDKLGFLLHDYAVDGKPVPAEEDADVATGRILRRAYRTNGVYHDPSYVYDLPAPVPALQVFDLKKETTMHYREGQRQDPLPGFPAEEERDAVTKITLHVAHWDRDEQGSVGKRPVAQTPMFSTSRGAPGPKPKC